MRHRVRGRKLGVVTEHRIAMLRNMATSLFEKERIKTTVPRAKELRSYAEKLITKAKRGGLHARRQVACDIHDNAVVQKLFDTLSARYAERPGGYTRITKIGPRRGDAAPMAYIELVDRPLPKKAEKKPKKKAAAPEGEAAAAKAATAPAGSAGKVKKSKEAAE